MEQAIWVGYGLLVAVCWGLGPRALHAAFERRGVLTAGFAWGRDRLWLALGGAACWVPYAWGALEMLREAARRRRLPAAPGGDEAARTLFLYSLAQAAVALIFPPGLASAYRSGGGVHSPLLVSVVAVVGRAAALAAAVAFSSSARRSPAGARRIAGRAQ